MNPLPGDSPSTLTNPSSSQQHIARLSLGNNGESKESVSGTQISAPSSAVQSHTVTAVIDVLNVPVTLIRAAAVSAAGKISALWAAFPGFRGGEKKVEASQSSEVCAAIAQLAAVQAVAQERAARTLAVGEPGDESFMQVCSNIHVLIC